MWVLKGFVFAFLIITSFPGSAYSIVFPSSNAGLAATESMKGRISVLYSGVFVPGPQDEETPPRVETRLLVEIPHDMPFVRVALEPPAAQFELFPSPPLRISDRRGSSGSAGITLYWELIQRDEVRSKLLLKILQKAPPYYPDRIILSHGENQTSVSLRPAWEHDALKAADWPSLPSRDLAPRIRFVRMASALARNVGEISFATRLWGVVDLPSGQKIEQATFQFFGESEPVVGSISPPYNNGRQFMSVEVPPQMITPTFVPYVTVSLALGGDRYERVFTPRYWPCSRWVYRLAEKSRMRH